MDGILSQTTRTGSLLTVLGDDALVLQRFGGTDHLNALFSYQVDCLATASDLDFDKLLGTHATVSLMNRTGSSKHFDGIVTSAQWRGTGENGHKYQLTLKPWLFLSTLKRNQRIFHNKTAPQIIEEVLSFYSSTGKVENTLTENYPVLEYTVQFRESDFNFVSRLMESYGISYYFRHEKGAHIMVLTEVSEAHDHIGERPYKPNMRFHLEDIEHFWEWGPLRRITTGAIRLVDYNFKTPQAVMEAEYSGSSNYENGDLESYEWPGNYLDQSEGQLVAKLNAERAGGQEKRYEALGDIADLSAGMMVGLSGDTVPGTGCDFICLSAAHSYTSESYGSTLKNADKDEYGYMGRYVLMPSDSPLVPELKTPLADVRGPQTAVVVGSGEVDCDDFGRILVRFHWDLDNAYSMRCRVSQNWAGSSWGGMVIPRIGMEVVVEFLDGDPDKPLVTGCVYNARNMPSLTLPAMRTQSTFKTNTVGGKGSNELTFEDQAGGEFVYLHAQKDHNTVIGNDESHQIGNNRSKSVGNDQSESVGNNKTISVGSNHTESISGNSTIAVTGNLSTTTTSNRTDTTQGNTSWTVSSGTYTFNVAASTASYSVQGDVTRNYSSRHTETTVGLRQVGAAGLDFSTGGAGTAQGGKITLNATEEICLTAGGSSLTLLKNGTIFLTGKNVIVSGSTNAAVVSDTQVDLSGPIANVTGKTVSVGGDSVNVGGTTEVNVSSEGTITSSAGGEHSVCGSILKLN